MRGRPFVWLVGLCALGAVATAGTARAAAFANGSFETGPSVPSASFTTLYATDTSVTGWTISSGSVDDIDTGYWQAEDGSRSLDMSGVGPGRIEQTFDTMLGYQYTVTFYLAGNTNAGCGSSVKGLDVDATRNPSAHYAFDVTGHSTSSMGWVQETYTFVATGTSTTLAFQSADASPCGPALDNVSVTEAPPVPALSPAAATTLALLLAAAGVLALGRRAAA